MDYLACYTVKENVESGIAIDEFECVAVEDTSTTIINNAVLQIVPVLSPDNDKSLNSVSEASLSFLKPPTKRDTLSKDYVLIATDPAQWKLCYSKDSFGLLDPCGLNGMVLLLVRNDTKHVLVSAKDRHVELSVADGKPVIGRCNRASLIFDTVNNNALKREISKLPSQFLITGSKAAKGSVRS